MSTRYQKPGSVCRIGLQTSGGSMHPYLELFQAASVIVVKCIADFSGIFFTEVKLLQHTSTHAALCVVHSWGSHQRAGGGLYQGCRLFCFFGSRRKIWKSLDQIKPDFTLSYIDCMPEKIWFAFFFFCLDKKNEEKPFRLYAVEHFFHNGLPRDKAFRFSFCCGVLNLIYGIAKMVWGSLFNTPACLARE